jgi:hypothetical protein
MNGSVQNYRPKLIWRIISPVGAVTTLTMLVLGEEVDGGMLYVSLAAATLVVWTIYLWTAKLTIEDDRFATLRHFGRSKPQVDLRSISDCQVGLTFAFPYLSSIISVRDTSGHGLRLTRVYWEGWNSVRQILG